MSNDKYEQRWAHITEEQMERLAPFIRSVAASHLEAMEFLDVVEEAAAEEFDATDEELEFVHATITHPEFFRELVLA